MKLLNLLSDAYNKNPNSNLRKVIGLVTSQLDELTATFEKIEAWRVIDNAKGQTLDDIGRDSDQHRGKATDEIYRIMLRSKTARDMSEGDTNTIIEVLSMAIDADPSEISIQETWTDDSPEPAGLRIIEIPIQRLNEVGMSSKQFVQFVAGTVAAGVAVKSVDLQGTFEYGGVPLENDLTKGFGSIDSNNGGYYGALYNPDEIPV
ncbi:hypothetical protein G4V62_13750 [Bacillaceae bacterium SIJ1]|uniref:hypothetical protein n=1 Tax=Litoribacterium kuwaitense TaxID=1398745 RepID=UPI0013EDFF5F|nr:hypothetical protein [Litoribacterium kuwaitense]NGP45958.1 hypothetical protein [Litoribacterium kuwaitense]